MLLRHCSGCRLSQIWHRCTAFTNQFTFTFSFPKNYGIVWWWQINHGKIWQTQTYTVVGVQDRKYFSVWLRVIVYSFIFFRSLSYQHTPFQYIVIVIRINVPFPWSWCCIIYILFFTSGTTDVRRLGENAFECWNDNIEFGLHLKSKQHTNIAKRIIKKKKRQEKNE